MTSKEADAQHLVAVSFIARIRPKTITATAAWAVAGCWKGKMSKRRLRRVGTVMAIDGYR